MFDARHCQRETRCLLLLFSDNRATSIENIHSLCMLWYKVAWFSHCNAQADAGRRIVWGRQSGVWVSSSQKNFSILKEKTKDRLGNHTVFLPPVLHSPFLFCWPQYFHWKFGFLCTLPWFSPRFSLSAVILCISCYICFHIAFFLFLFLNLPSADSFCLCDLPNFIHPFCSYRNRVFASRWCVCACIHSCSHFLSSSNFWTTFKQCLKEGQRSKVLWK